MRRRSRFDICRVCGERLDIDHIGRRRKFCSAACRQKNYREEKKWTKKAVDAALAGEPEPPKDWLHPTFQKVLDEVLRNAEDRA